MAPTTGRVARARAAFVFLGSGPRDDASAADGQALPNTSFVCAVTRTKVVRFETSFRWAAPI